MGACYCFVGPYTQELIENCQLLCNDLAFQFQVLDGGGQRDSWLVLSCFLNGLMAFARKNDCFTVPFFLHGFHFFTKYDLRGQFITKL